MNKQQTQQMFSIRKKLLAAVAMLLVACIMTVSSTYAWFTLSPAPEVKGIATKVVPGAIPALDCPVIFNVAPNALILGFLCGLAGSILAILVFTPMGLFPAVVIPLAFTCFFEGGAAAIVANAYGGVRGTVIATFINGIVMVLLVGFGAYFFSNTIQDWMLVYGGNDFSLFGIIEGIVAKLIA